MLQIYEIHIIYRYWYYIAIDIYEYVSMYKPSTYIYINQSFSNCSPDYCIVSQMFSFTG